MIQLVLRRKAFLKQSISCGQNVLCGVFCRSISDRRHKMMGSRGKDKISKKAIDEEEKKRIQEETEIEEEMKNNPYYQAFISEFKKFQYQEWMKFHEEGKELNAENIAQVKERVRIGYEKLDQKFVSLYKKSKDPSTSDSEKRKNLDHVVSMLNKADEDFKVHPLFHSVKEEFESETGYRLGEHKFTSEELKEFLHWTDTKEADQLEKLIDSAVSEDTLKQIGVYGPPEGSEEYKVVEEFKKEHIPKKDQRDAIRNHDTSKSSDSASGTETGSTSQESHSHSKREGNQHTSNKTKSEQKEKSESIGSSGNNNNNSDNPKLQKLLEKYQVDNLRHLWKKEAEKDPYTKALLEREFGESFDDIVDNVMDNIEKGDVSAQLILDYMIDQHVHKK